MLIITYVHVISLTAISIETNDKKIMEVKHSEKSKFAVGNL